MLIRRLAGAALAVILMGLCAPAFAVGADSPAVATPNHDCGAMPAGREHGAVQMPVARVARYGPPAYLKFSSLLL